MFELFDGCQVRVLGIDVMLVFVLLGFVGVILGLSLVETLRCEDCGSLLVVLILLESIHEVFKEF